MLDRRTINVLLTTFVFVLAVALVYVVRTILALFVFSILCAYLINPVVRVLQRYSLFFKDLKGLHIFQAYLAFLILLALLVHTFAPDLRSRPGALGNLPAFADSVASAEIANNFGQNLGWTDAQTLRLKTFLQGHRSTIESARQAIQRSAVTMAGAFLVIPILAIFFPSDGEKGEKLANQLILLIPAASEGSAVRSLVADFNLMLQRYIRIPSKASIQIQCECVMTPKPVMVIAAIIHPEMGINSSIPASTPSARQWGKPSASNAMEEKRNESRPRM